MTKSNLVCLLALVVISAFPSPIVGEVTRENNKTCPNKLLLEAGLRKAASQNCVAQVKSAYQNNEVPLEPGLAYTSTDNAILEQAIVDAINEAIADGDDGFPPFVVDKIATDFNKTVKPTLELFGKDEDGDGSRQLRNSHSQRKAQVCTFAGCFGMEFSYVHYGHCRYCKPDNADGRVRLLREPSGSGGPRGRRRMDEVTFFDDDNYTYADDDFYYDDDSFYDDDDSFLFGNETDEFELVSDRIVRILESSGRTLFRNITCLSISCDGSPFIDVTGDCDDLSANQNPVPTPAPTSAPSPPSFCFSGDSEVNTLDNGVMKMKDLELGEMIHVGNGDYEPIYSFGHYGPQATAEFLEISTASSEIQLSAAHMVAQPTAAGGEDRFVPASQLKTGHVLVDGQGKTVTITNIRTIVSASGVYAPFTASGKLVVNGILASSFVSLTGTETLTVMGVFTFSHHFLAHAWERPHVWYCATVGGCDIETYTQEGISTWVAGPFAFFVWMIDLPTWVSTTGMIVGMVMYQRITNGAKQKLA